MIKEYIHKFLEVYFDNSTIFGLLKKHVSSLHLMRCAIQEVINKLHRWENILEEKKILWVDEAMHL